MKLINVFRQFGLCFNVHIDGQEWEGLIYCKRNQSVGFDQGLQHHLNQLAFVTFLSPDFAWNHCRKICCLTERLCYEKSFSNNSTICSGWTSKNGLLITWGCLPVRQWSKTHSSMFYINLTRVYSWVICRAVLDGLVMIGLEIK